MSKKPVKKYPPRDSRFLAFCKICLKNHRKNGCIPRRTVVFWNLWLQKKWFFPQNAPAYRALFWCTICPKNHYKKRLYLPRDSRFLESKSSKNESILQYVSKKPLQKTAVSPSGQSFFWIYHFSHIHFVILQHYGVI